MKCDAVVEKAWQWKGCEKIDVLEGTALEKWGKELGFGLWLFRRKIPVRHVHVWAAQCAEMFSGHGRAMKVGKRVGAYDTIQATIRNCTCKYDYPGVAAHQVVHLPNPRCGVLTDMLNYMHGSLDVGSGDNVEFNEVLANQYKVFDQDISYHTDANDLLDKNPTIISISLGATGAFCYAPVGGTKFGQQWCHNETKTGTKLTAVRESQRNAGVKGIVPLGAGDILVMWGEFPTVFSSQDVTKLHGEE